MVVHAGQVHVFFTAQLTSDFAPGEETLETRLFSKEEIPWSEIAFPSGVFALERYFEDQGKNNGTHLGNAPRVKY